jgi:hypothetical protein
MRSEGLNFLTKPSRDCDTTPKRILFIDDKVRGPCELEIDKWVWDLIDFNALFQRTDTDLTLWGNPNEQL